MAAELFGRAASRLHQQTLQKSWVVLHGYAGGRLIRRTAVVRTRMPGGVGGVASRDAPLSRLNTSSAVRRSHRRATQRPANPATAEFWLAPRHGIYLLGRSRLFRRKVGWATAHCFPG